jgi:hypothetical protein
MGFSKEDGQCGQALKHPLTYITGIGKPSGTGGPYSASIFIMRDA